MIVYTLGHSNRSFEEFLEILRKYKIKYVVDVRRFPKSKFKWFSKEFFEKELPKYKISYFHFEELGGYRKFGKDVRDRGIALKTNRFRAYITYLMYNRGAKKKMKELENLIRSGSTLILCSERFPWKCHRSIISDFLTARGIEVIHIIDLGKEIKHKLTKGAYIKDGEIYYL